jgi:hypothetical protein
MSTTATSDDTDLLIEETAALIASDKVEGTAVYDANLQRLGAVRNFMVNKRSGQVAYAVISFGGFLGIGQRYYPIPWKELTYDVDQGGYVINLSRDRLDGAPAFAADTAPDWTDPRFGRRISDYYA